MSPADVVRQLSHELAREPGSEVFRPLAELLAAQGQHRAALAVARRGAVRHPECSDAQALVARLAAAEEAWDEADAAWTRALAGEADAPVRAAAYEGRAFVAYRQGRFDDAWAHLDAAEAAGAAPERVAAARARVARGQAEGALPPARHVEPPHAVARELAAVGDQATRAMVHLALGAWQRIVVETHGARVGLAPSEHDVVLVATPASAPPGQLGRLLDRATMRAAGAQR